MRFSGRILLCAVCLVLAFPAVAGTDAREIESRRGISDQFQISLGAWVKNFNSGSRLDSETLGTGTGLDFEDDLGLEKDRSDVRLDGFYRFSPRHRLEFGYTFWTRDITTMLSEQIQYGDEIYTVGATLSSEVDTHLVKLAYKYSFVNNGKFEAGISGGLSTLVFQVRLAADAVVMGGGGGGAAGASVEEDDVVAPVPVIGAHFDYTIRKRLFLRTSFEIFDVDVDTVGARLADVRATIDWYPWQHFGFGVGYNSVHIDFQDTEVPAVFVDYNFSGALAYASYVF